MIKIKNKHKVLSISWQNAIGDFVKNPQMVIFIKTPKVHRLSVRNLGTGNIAESVKTKRPMHRQCCAFCTTFISWCWCV